MKHDNKDQEAPHKSFTSGKEKKSYSVNQNTWRRCFLALGCGLFIFSGIFFGVSGEASQGNHLRHRASHLKSDARKHRKARAAHKAVKGNESRLESEPKQEGEFEEDINQRQNWFYSQRAYPFNSIPEKTREKAWASRLIGQDERDGPTSAAPYWGNIGPSPTTASRVAQIGTTSGRINAIAVSPTNDQLVLIGASTGGVWRSTDGGANFLAASDSQVDLAVGSIAFAPSNTSIVYAGMGDGPGAGAGGGYLGTGVLKSTDAGLSWTRINNDTLPAEGTTMQIAVDPSNPDRVYLAQRTKLDAVANQTFSSGFWLSTSGGVSWTRTLAGVARGFAISSADAQTIYLAMSSLDDSRPAGVYKSINGGLSWATAPIYTSPFSSPQDIRVAVSPSNAQKIFVYSGDKFSKGNLRLAVSTDGGATFPVDLALNGAAVDNTQFGYNTYLVAHPTNANTIYIGSRDIFRSIDSGNTWTNVTTICQYNATTGDWDYPSPNPNAKSHSDQQTMAFSPTNSNVIYVGSDGGLQKSTNAGGTFVSLNGTLSLSQFVGYALHPTNTGLAYGGTQDNGTQRRQVSGSVYSHWQEFSAGDGGHVVINPTDPTIVFSTYVLCDVRRYVGSGDTIGDFSNNVTFGEPALGQRVAFYPPYVGNGVNSTLYFGTWRLFVNTDPITNLSNPLSWLTPTTSPANQDLTKGATDVLTAIGVASQAYGNQQEIYTGSAQGRVMASTNGGATFTDASGLPNRFVTSITVDPANSAVAFVTFSGFHSEHVFKTTDFGESWASISGNLNQDLPVNTFLIDPVASGTYYVGTDTGVFRSTDGGGAWESYNNGLPPVIVNALVAQPGGTIHAATFGRGAYELVKQFDLNGRVKRSNGVAIDGVTITLVGDGRTTTTDASGNYAFTNLTGGLSYSVTPSKPGYTFAPTTQNLMLTSDTTLTDFVGSPPPPIAYTFIGAANGCSPQGDTTAWSNPCNWSPQGVPTANDVVTTGNNTINAGAVRVSAIVINGGTFNGTINIADAGQWTGGQFSGVLNIETAANFSIDGADKFLANASINNSGTIFWSASEPTGRINFGGTIVINNTGRFSATTDGLMFHGTSFPANMSFVNNGTFEKTGGSGVTRFTDYGTFNNTSGGIINSNIGTLQFVQDLQLNNNSFITGAGVVQKAGGNTGVDEVAINGQVTVTGNFDLNGYLLGNPGATFVSTGNHCRWTAGQIRGVLSIASGSQFNIEGNNKALSNATINNAGTILWSESAALGRIDFGGNIVINNTGRFSATTDGMVFHAAGFPASMNFNNSGTFEKTGGSGVTTFTDYQLFNNNNGGIINSNSGTLRFTEALQLRDNSFITGAGVVQKAGGSPGDREASVEGHLTVTGNFDLAGALSGEPGAAIVSTGNHFRWTGGLIRGEINIPSSTQLNIEGNDKVLAAATLNNAGTILWSGSDITGRINLSGTSIITNTGRFTATTDGLVFWVTGFPVSMTFNNSGIFEKTGGSGITLFSNYFPFNNSGTISVQTGIVRAVGLSITPTSTIASRIAGTTPGTGFGQLIIDGGITLDGTLNVTFANGFTAAAGSAFPLLTFGSRSGTFANVNIPSVAGRTFDLEYNNQDVVLATIGDCATACASAPSGLVNWWPGNGNTNDIVGNRNGSMQGGTVFAPGKVGQGYKFDGVDDSVDLGNWFNLQTFSLSMWLKPGSTQVDYADILDNSNQAGINWVIQQDGGTTNHYVYGDTGVVLFELTPGVWQHLVITRGSDNIIKAYVDSQEVSSVTAPGPINYNGAQFLRMGQWGGGGRHWNGRLDELDVYDRVLTQGEVQSLYNAACSGKCGLPVTVQTPAGANVTVRAGSVSLTFDQVTQAGTITVTPINPAGGGTPPSGFIITQDSVAYEITTTAIFTGTIRIDIPLTTNLQNIRSQLGLLHGEMGALVDRTISTNNFSTISARVTSLSPFVVAQTAGCVTSVVTSGQVAGASATQSFAATAATGSIDVTSQNDCNWTATSNDSWITVTSASGGTGNGTVTYSVAANPATTIRSGSIIISGQRFSVLQGAAFLDVPTTDIFYTYIGKLSARGVTVGCGNGNYCPNDPVTQEQMAAFIVRALGDFTPVTPAQQRFADVLPNNPFYPFIDEMAVRQITVGCGGGNYCPSSPVLREQMAAFMIRALGEFSPPTPGSQRFNDVSPANPFYNFIDRMAVLQITSGCSPVLYCPGSPVTRGQMAVFLVRAFNL